jgi:hypothetical protein
MNTVARWTIALALFAGPMVAESQTYDLKWQRNDTGLHKHPRERSV